MSDETRRIEIGVIQDIEKFRPELKPHTLTQARFLKRGKIP
jgi:hypothetical protein